VDSITDDTKNDNGRHLPSAWKETYTVHNILGKGMSGKVYRVNQVSSPNQFAIKVMPLDAHLMPDEIEDMRRECQILKEVSHPHILAYKNHVEEKKVLYLLTELLQGDELFDYITKRTTYKESDAKAVTKVMLEVLEYLHSQNIVHRDLKPENIILSKADDPTSVKIVDFGLACKVKDKFYGITKPAGTPGYLPPEALVHKANYGMPSDIWAVGVITYILLCGYPPFYGESDVDLFRDIRRAKVEFDDAEWSPVSSTAKKFIQCIFEKNPTKRPTASQLLQNEWIKQDTTGSTDGDLGGTVTKLKKTRAMLRLKKCVKGVIFANRCKNLSAMITSSLDKSKKEAAEEEKKKATA